jgi:hypothetical protein
MSSNVQLGIMRVGNREAGWVLVMRLTGSFATPSRSLENQQCVCSTHSVTPWGGIILRIILLPPFYHRYYVVPYHAYSITDKGTVQDLLTYCSVALHRNLCIQGTGNASSDRASTCKGRRETVDSRAGKKKAAKGRFGQAGI